jgi:hypothetical protein
MILPHLFELGQASFKHKVLKRNSNLVQPITLWKDYKVKKNRIFIGRA